MSEPSDKSRVRTRSRTQSVSDKEKFVLQQALCCVLIYAWFIMILLGVSNVFVGLGNLLFY